MAVPTATASFGSPIRSRSAEGVRRERVTIAGSPTWEEDLEAYLARLPEGSPACRLFASTGTTVAPSGGSPASDRFAGASPSAASPLGRSPTSQVDDQFFEKAVNYFGEGGRLSLPADLTESTSFSVAMDTEGVSLADFGEASTIPQRRQLYLLACILQERDKILLSRPTYLDDYWLRHPYPYGSGYSYLYSRHHAWRLEEDRQAVEYRQELEAIERKRQLEIAQLQAKLQEERELRLRRWRLEEEEAARRREQIRAEQEAARLREAERVEAARRREAQRLADEAARLREAQRAEDERRATERARRQREADEALAALRAAQETEDRRRRERALDLELERLRIEREREANLRRLRYEVVDRVVDYHPYVPVHYVPRSRAYYYYSSYVPPPPVVRSVEYFYP